MTPPDTAHPVAPTVAEIAGRLTKAQRKWLPAFGSEWVGHLPIGMSRATRDKLIQLGLVEVLRPTAFGLIKYRLTPLGLSVRAHIQNEERP